MYMTVPVIVIITLHCFMFCSRCVLEEIITVTCYNEALYCSMILTPREYSTVRLGVESSSFCRSIKSLTIRGHPLYIYCTYIYIRGVTVHKKTVRLDTTQWCYSQFGTFSIRGRGNWLCRNIENISVLNHEGEPMDITQAGGRGTPF